MNRCFMFPEEETVMANKYTEICSPSLWIREMQTEIKISFYTHKTGNTQCGWRCRATGIHAPPVGVPSLRRLSGIILWSQTWKRLHDPALSLPSALYVPGDTYSHVCTAPHWLTLTLCEPLHLPMPLFLHLQNMDCNTCLGLVVRIHIYKSTKNWCLLCGSYNIYRLDQDDGIFLTHWNKGSGERILGEVQKMRTVSQGWGSLVSK